MNREGSLRGKIILSFCNRLMVDAGEEVRFPIALLSVQDR